MKKNILLFLIMILIATLARAEKTYVKDSAECLVDGEKFFLTVRSKNLITTSDDDRHGEILELKHRKKIHKIDSSELLYARYRFLWSENNYCSNTLTLKFAPDKLVLLLLRDNRPFADTLMLLYVNTKTWKTYLIPTKITTSVAYISGDKAYLKLTSGVLPQKYEKVLIKGSEYIASERTLDTWLQFDGKDFSLDRDETYKNFEYKDLLSKKDLEYLSAFRETKYTLAIDAVTGKTCLSLYNANWSCK